MGCGSSHDAYVRDRRAYHGVAMVPVVSPISPASNEFVGSSTVPNLHSWEAHAGAHRKGNDDFYFGVNEALQRRMRRQRIAEWRQTTLGIVREKQCRPAHSPRYDHLTKFGSSQLGMVDELSTCTSRGTDAAAQTMSDGATRSGDRSLPSSLSTSGCTTFVNHASIRLDANSPKAPPHHPCVAGAALNISAGPREGSALTKALASVNSTAVSSTASSTTRRPLPLRGYAVQPCNNGHAHRVRLVLLVPQGDIVLSCSTVERHLTAYHLRLQTEVGRMVGHDDVILGGAVRPDGRLVATASRDCTVILWELPSCKQRRSLPHPAAVHACRFSASDGEVATACADGLCRVWTWSADTDVAHTLVSLATGFDGPLTSLAYTMGDRHLVAGGAGNAVFVWDRQRFAEAAAAFRHHRSAVLSVDASQTQAGVVASADEHSVYVWNCASLAIQSRLDVDLWCTPRRRSPRTKVSFADVEGSGGAAVQSFYWTTVRLVDTRCGVFVVAAASDKCAHLFNVPDASNAATQAQSSSNEATAITAASASVTELLSLPLSSSLSCVDGGLSNLIALGDTCGNRHILTLV